MLMDLIKVAICVLVREMIRNHCGIKLPNGRFALIRVVLEIERRKFYESMSVDRYNEIAIYLYVDIITLLFCFPYLHNIFLLLYILGI